MDRKADSSTATPTAPSLPEAFEHYPFAYRSCTVDCSPTADEQAAYSRYSRTHRSAERFWADAPKADWMLDILGKLWDHLPVAPDVELRTFAVRCVEGLEAAANPRVQELLDVVRRHLDGAATLDELSALQEATHRHVAQGGVQGLPRCSTYAAAMLAAWHAADRDPRLAASWTTEFAARHDAFVVLHQRAAAWHWPEDRGEPWRADWRTAFFAKAHPHVKAAAMANARRRQATLLRSILPAPWGTPVRGEVYFGEADESGDGPVYCMTCGVQRGDATPGVIFDVRGMLCKACRAPVARCVH